MANNTLTCLIASGRLEVEPRLERVLLVVVDLDHQGAHHAGGQLGLRAELLAVLLLLPLLLLPVGQGALHVDLHPAGGGAAQHGRVAGALLAL